MSNLFLPQNLQNLVEAKQNVTNRLHPFNSSFCDMSFVPLYWLMMRVALKGMKKGGNLRLTMAEVRLESMYPFERTSLQIQSRHKFLDCQVFQVHLISRIIIFISLINAGITVRCYFCFNRPLSRGGHFVSRDLKSFVYARLAS